MLMRVSSLNVKLLSDMGLSTILPVNKLQVQLQPNISLNQYLKKIDRKEKHLGLVVIDLQINLILFLNCIKTQDLEKYSYIDPLVLKSSEDENEPKFYDSTSDG